MALAPLPHFAGSPFIYSSAPWLRSGWSGFAPWPANRRAKSRTFGNRLKFLLLLGTLLLPAPLLSGCGVAAGGTAGGRSESVYYTPIEEDGGQNARTAVTEAFGSEQAGGLPDGLADELASESDEPASPHVNKPAGEPTEKATFELAAGQTAKQPEAAAKAAAARPQKPRLGLVLKSFNNLRHRAMASEARKFIRQYHPDEAAGQEGLYELSVKHAPHDAATHSQAAAVDELVAEKVRIIALAPINSEDSLVLAQAVKRALEAGVLLVTFDEPLNRAGLAEAGIPEDLLFIGPDNTAGAGRLAELLAAGLGKEAKVAILEDQSPLVTERENALRRLGYLDVIQKHHLKLVENKPGGKELESAGQAVRELLKNQRDLQALLVTGPVGGNGAVLALEEAKRDGRVKVIAYGSSRDNLELIREGRLLAMLEDNPETWAVQALQAGLAALAEADKPDQTASPEQPANPEAGQPDRQDMDWPRGWIVTETGLVTRESLEGETAAPTAPAAPAAAEGQTPQLILRDGTEELLNILSR